MFLLPRHNSHRNVACCENKHIDHFQPHNNFPAQSLHFRFGSVAPCPTLKSDVTASTPRTRYRRLAKPYPTGFPCYIQSAYKSKQNFFFFFHSLEEISLADFSARTTDSIISRNPLSNKRSFYFCAIHLPPAEEGEFLLYYVKYVVMIH